MRIVAAIGWLLGLGMLAGLIGSQGAAEVLAAVALAGWGLALLCCARLGTLLVDTLGWQRLLPDQRGTRLGSLLLRRWIGSSVNSLLPVAQLGGEVVRARLLARVGLRRALAGASVVVDLTLGLAAQIAFIALGLALLAGRFEQHEELLEIAAAVVAFALLVIGFGAAQRGGLFTMLARALRRLALGRGAAELIGGAAALEGEIRGVYARRRAVLACGLWRFLGWLSGGLEIWLALLIIGQPVGLLEAVILESLGQAVRSAGFAIPGGLGLQEGTVTLAGVWLGLAPELALAGALLRRTAELACGVPGLFAWSFIESYDLGRGGGRS